MKHGPIAICAAGEVFGGLEKFVLQLSLELKKKNVPVVLYVIEKGILWEKAGDLQLDRVWIRQNSKRDLSGSAEAAASFKEKGIRVVHTNGYKANIYFGLAAKKAGIPALKTEHGGMEKFSGLAWLKMRANLLLDKLLSLSTMKKVVFVSHDLSDLSAFPLSGEKAVIPNGVQTFSPSVFEMPGLKKDKTTCAFIGRIEKVKGLHVLLEAMKINGEDGPNLLVFGEGSEKEDLERWSQQAGLGSKVQFMGFRKDLEDFLPSLDFIVMPSFHEGLPFTLLEAGAAGVPFVGSRVGGLSEFFKDGIEGTLVPPGDPAALAKAIQTMTNNPELRKNMGNKMKERVLSEFSAEKMTDQYLALYGELEAVS